MTILLFINIIHVVKAIEDHKEEQQMMTVARLASVAKVTAVVTVISDFILNFLPVFTRSNLTECKCYDCTRCIHGTIDHSIWSIDLP